MQCLSESRRRSDLTVYSSFRICGRRYSSTRKSRFVQKNPNTSLASKVFAIDSISHILHYNDSSSIRKMITFDSVVLLSDAISDVNCRSKNKDERNKFSTPFDCQVITKKVTAANTKLTVYSTPPKGTCQFSTTNNGVFIPRLGYGCNQ